MPRLVVRNNASELQLAHALVATPTDEPEKSEPRDFEMVCLSAYMFILTTIPVNAADAVDNKKPGKAPSLMKNIKLGEKNNNWSNTLNIIQNVVAIAEAISM